MLVLALGDDDAVLGAVDGCVLVRSLRAARPENCTQPDREGEEPEDADDGEQGEQAEDERLRPFMSEEAERDRRARRGGRRRAGCTPIWPGLSERSIAVVAVAAHCGLIRSLTSRFPREPRIQIATGCSENRDRQVRRGAASGARRIR